MYFFLVLSFFLCFVYHAIQICLESNYLGGGGTRQDLLAWLFSLRMPSFKEILRWKEKGEGGIPSNRIFSPFSVALIHFSSMRRNMGRCSDLGLVVIKSMEFHWRAIEYIYIHIIYCILISFKDRYFLIISVFRYWALIFHNCIIWWWMVGCVYSLRSWE